jgi:hypothetical protein
MRTLICLFAIACGAAAPDAAPTPTAAPAGLPHGDVAFQTYRYKGDTFKFATPTRLIWTWPNMATAPADGAWRAEGDTITIDFVSTPGGHGWKTAKLKQINPCELAMYWWEWTDGQVFDTDSRLWVKQSPECNGRIR